MRRSRPCSTRPARCFWASWPRNEFADGGPSFDLPWPPARNPWNTDHFTAGSSSGTGASVAAGLILGGLGTDTGGSIRGPAALCGISGIKPTYGLVSRRGVAPAAFSRDHIGPMGVDGGRLCDAATGARRARSQRSGQRRPSDSGLSGRTRTRREGPQDRRHSPFPTKSTIKRAPRRSMGSTRH